MKYPLLANELAPAQSRNNTKRPMLVFFLVPTKHLQSYASVRVENREMTGRTQTLPWWMTVLWIRNYFCPDPYPDLVPTFQMVSDPS
jgi:hypothetical protein